MQRVFRVCGAIHARLDGEGARRVGGRWNSPGRPVVYMTESIALVVLENLVHMNRQDFPVGYVVVAAAIPNDVNIILLSEQFPAPGGVLESQALGDLWLGRMRSAVLKIPSVIVPSEFNYLLNPLQPEFARIVAEIPIPFTFDERLLK